MKRMLLGGVIGLAIAVVTVAIWNAPAEAKKTLDEGDLDGTYSWSSVLVRDEAGVAVYCSGFGTATFDGAGNATIDSTDRCGVPLGVPDFDTQTGEAHTYTMDPNGIFHMVEVDTPSYVTHCQLLHKGEIILCDGVATDPEMLAFHVVGIKQ